ncbi:hypothetical protein [Sinosporangium siamense]|uniref:Uncharacterized protein n=1 Tax=Sinosporangium siamense TaxID=1367973 RepID=A0A919V7C4_9ACTN|nr:hypothetical protein [Sinosporangium siamense]GII93318.1 hypothetical protein Ssi02_35490 [Sinosporangium siamense]
MNNGLILLFFLAFLFAWLLNRVRRRLGFGPAAYSLVMLAFIVFMGLVWAQSHQ